jgi:iron complex outermembrane receptor protein
MDYFNVKVENVISAPSTQEIVSQNAAGNPAYAGLVLRDPVTNQIISTKTLLANTGTMDAEGIDINANYRENLGPGRLDVNLTGTYYIKFDQSTPGAGTSRKVGTMVDANGAPVISSTANLDGYGVVLRYKQYLSGTWTQGAWSTTLGNEYASGYAAGWDLNDNPTYMPSLSLWNLQVAYTGFKNTVLTLGSRNVFDKQPATFVSVSNAFQSGYDSSQYDPRGRVVFVSGAFKF